MTLTVSPRSSIEYCISPNFFQTGRTWRYPCPQIPTSCLQSLLLNLMLNCSTWWWWDITWCNSDSSINIKILYSNRPPGSSKETVGGWCVLLHSRSSSVCMLFTLSSGDLCTKIRQSTTKSQCWRDVAPYGDSTAGLSFFHSLQPMVMDTT